MENNYLYILPSLIFIDETKYMTCEYVKWLKLAMFSRLTVEWQELIERQVSRFIPYRFTRKHANRKNTTTSFLVTLSDNFPIWESKFSNQLAARLHFFGRDSCGASISIVRDIHRTDKTDLSIKTANRRSQLNGSRAQIIRLFYVSWAEFVINFSAINSYCQSYLR